MGKVVMYDKSKRGYSTVSGEPVEIIGEQRVMFEDKELDQYTRNIVGYKAKNGQPFVALKPNISLVSKD